MKIIIIIAMLFGMAGVASAAVEIGESEYPNAVKSGLSVVEFYSPSCPYCRNMEPVIAQFEKQYTGVKVYKLNVMKEAKDNRPTEFITNLKIESWPTFLVYKDGVEIYRFKGAMTPEKFAKRALISARPTHSQVIDIRIEDLQDEYNSLIERGNKMSEELRKTNERINQIPSAIGELNKLKAETLS